MEREGDRAKKGSEVRRSFVVDVEEGKRVRERFEEGDDRGEGGDVGGGRAVFERGEVDIPEVNGHEYVLLVPVHRFDGKTSRQVGRRPFAPVGSEGEAFEMKTQGTRQKEPDTIRNKTQGLRHNGRAIREKHQGTRDKGLDRRN